MVYRIYVDEVGNHTMKNTAHPDNRFLSLTGVIIEYEHISSDVHPQLEALKAKYLPSHNPPDEPVVFHREDVLHTRPPFDILRDRKVREEFDEELLTLLQSWNYRVITICLDKLAYTSNHLDMPLEPYYHCLRFLLEGYTRFLLRIGDIGDVMAESRGGNEDRALKEEFTRLYEQGTEQMSGTILQQVLTSRQLKVKTKASNVTGLQLADLVAHDSQSDILREHNLIDAPPSPFATRLADILRQKYDQHDAAIAGKILLLNVEGGHRFPVAAPTTNAAHLRTRINRIIPQTFVFVNNLFGGKI